LIPTSGDVAGATATSGRYVSRTVWLSGVSRNRSVYCSGFRLARRQYELIMAEATVTQSSDVDAGNP
jgi:hypothetical protein